ncbi:6-phosphofructokinase 1 [Actinobaculum suis]|uniref:ATP-dependent 6-phosphofructokinase n=1 Tax=Actinobaculum suis TaxID=1657 RepID=A0A0K9ETL2_9ACTO|nr:ATP-dependent 6-phosphofructokinase [Actinobaculum suis]KMY23197.1 6-phosphofructokinase [Actinobaculum suis]MDY5152664.1 ATP-dependent 6-phosphofructokinase [Actinobaculum suis]OCA95099.1 6-phosphofructokinase [Actinobaculum suis]OCA95721.1 6-phosphofructokinase [Actinobaculum suis]SDE10645.1 6-phosphofructokinase 1 [Actinobaculum suis]
MSKKKRVGILTAGGDSPGLNAAIRGFGKTAIGRYGMELIGFRNGITGLVRNNFQGLGSEDLAGILTMGGTMLGTSRDKVHKFPDGEGGTFNAIPQIKENFEKDELDALVMIGGGGTAKNAKRLVDAGLPVIHLPKTIDNDIMHTDTSFGFSTALGIATEAIDRLHSTAHSHHRIIVVEIMGHRAGWLTLGAGIAGGADIILIPEIPYTIEKCAEYIQRRADHGRPFSVVAVAEGAHNVEVARRLAAANELVTHAKNAEAKQAAKEHRRTIEANERDSSFRVAEQLEAATGLEARVTVLGYVQRGGIPDQQDRLLGTLLGGAGANAVAEGNFGVMIASRNGEAVPVPLAEVAGKDKLVPVDHPWVEAARNVGTSLGD